MQLFLFKLDKTVADVKNMIEAYDNCSVGNSMCCEWFAKF